MSRGRRTRGVRTAVIAAALGAASIIGHRVVAKATRDALFLSTFDVDLLPRATIAAAAASLVSALVAARAVARYGPATVVTVSLVCSALLHGGEWSLLRSSPGAAAILLYLHVGLLGATTLTAFWSLINERFDPHTAKREISRVTMGGTVGGALGGLLAWQLGSATGVPALLVVLALLDVGAAACVPSLKTTLGTTAALAAVNASGGRTLSRVPYLRQLAALVALCALCSAMLDYVLGVHAVRAFGSGAELVAFFALFHASIGLLAFFVQLTATRPALERFGLAAAVGLLPAVLLGAGAIAFAIPRLWSAVLLRAGEGIVSSSIYRAGYELSYTPLPPAEKRPAKMLIDVGLDRLGAMVGGGIAVAAIALLPGGASRWLTLATMLAACAALWFALRLHRGYVSALARSLESGAVRLSHSDLIDATTRRTLAETSALDRRALLAEIERHRSQSERAPAHVEDDVLLARIADLRSGDRERARAVLSEPLTGELAPFALDLLADDHLSRSALAALRSAGPRITGLLVDALLDPTRDPIVRRRIPRVLESVPSVRSMTGLVEALGCDEPDARFQAALALLRMREAEPALAIPESTVLEAASREAERLTSERSLELGERELDGLIAMLSLVLDREPLGLAHRALYSTDPSLRGTALEYLENVLPEKLRSSSMSLFSRARRQGVEHADVPPPSLGRRKRGELVAELLRSRKILVEELPPERELG